MILKLSLVPSTGEHLLHFPFHGPESQRARIAGQRAIPGGRWCPIVHPIHKVGR